MPEYLAPGVYVEEVSFRSKSIEGVSTSTAGFVGPACYGPVGGEPVFVTSFAEFERIFGGLDQLVFQDESGDDQPAQHNFLAHGVRAFFEEGGRRLYVSRIYNPPSSEEEEEENDGRARANFGIVSPPMNGEIVARFPGRCGNMRITFVPQLSDNLLVTDPISDQPEVRRIQEHDTVLEISGTPSMGTLYDVVRVADDLVLRNDGVDLDLVPGAHTIHLLTVNVLIEKPIFRPKRPNQQYEDPIVQGEFSFHPLHRRALTAYFTENPASRLQSLSVPFAISIPDTSLVNTGYEMAESLLGNQVIDALADVESTQAERQRIYRLEEGSDGVRPTAKYYFGERYDGDRVKSGLEAFEDIEDISIVAAPGYSHGYIEGQDPDSDIETIQAHLINHCHKMRYRVAVLDSPNNQALSEIRGYRSKVDSTHSTMYYPWITIQDPITEEEVNLPPSGFVAGIYARNDVDHGVHKAPANEVVRLSVGFELLLNKAQQDVLNPEGINCFRFFPGRGYRLWGARTISSDPEWKYVNVRRYFAFLEHSIDKGTQWVVFENNGPALWANVRRTVSDFLFNEWKSGHLLGEKPEKAYFVRCDRSTMTQNDLDNGRLICLIGVSVLKPAEFVIFRIGQWTADSNR